MDNDENIWFHEIKGEHGIQGFWGVFNENGLPPFLAPPTSVEEQSEATDGIALYPNPTNTSFTIRGADNITSVKIMNSLGVEVSRKSLVVSGKVEVDVDDLASGIYFVQMRTPTGMITKSIVVSR
ncbi:MAG: T9SS type A sorting domain-containing protein [Ignavibacteria bacterium]|nr:T9SS type A sorting domain-containing protein [Ignavibacteria bacterium]